MACGDEGVVHRQMSEHAWNQRLGPQFSLGTSAEVNGSHANNGPAVMLLLTRAVRRSAYQSATRMPQPSGCNAEEVGLLPDIAAVSAIHGRHEVRLCEVFLGSL